MAIPNPLKVLLQHKPTPADGQMELMEHLAELRTRIFRSLLYVALGMAISYYSVPLLFRILTAPLAPLMKSMGVQIAFRSMVEGFLLWMQVCFISGLVLALPLVVLELWGFIKPALTEEERKPVSYLAPFSVLLFFAGVGTGYACLPTTFAWMATYLDDFGKVTILQDVTPYILLTVKILLAFGVAFQLPLLLLFLARVGIINAKMMATYWRHAVVGISVISAVLTPSNDPLTMLMMAVPMAGLYMLSIGLVRAFEPKEDGSRAPGLKTMMSVALAPVAILAAVAFWLTRPARTSVRDADSKVHAAGDAPTMNPGPAGDKPLANSPEDLRRTIDRQNQLIETLTRRVEALEKPKTPQ